MSVRLISYDLKNGTEEDYGELIGAITSLGDYCHPLSSQWLVDTDLSAREIKDILKAKLKAGDHILVSTLTGDYAGRVKESHLKWIRAHQVIFVG
ncbi:hypothetical protein SAMN02745823_00525 [Sporobacter termitidis DSM 10068]|uniref:Uncharacterized protein n=1 Tax=Sporobacter termitidis DSM 10068 TaxID=1123282 RepID=A0A1M5UHL5_9FIRM|nr:hypothetical protein [Sporobacter termitidis]SHH62421.1 hypothetical protein SAMN02745823_00525 [Sporobacter termitidis DSM 10068]